MSWAKIKTISFDVCASIPFSLFLQEFSQSLFTLEFSNSNVRSPLWFVPVFLNFHCCRWYEGGQKWNRTFSCICCLLQCSMGFHTPQNSGFNVSCTLLMSLSTSLLSILLHTNYFFFLTPLNAYVFVSCGLVVFFPMFNSLNLFLAFVLPSTYYFRNFSSYSRCSICYCTSDAIVV